ncbi:hypothetical protein Clacol_002187 [Clathrus columnatus]|uniref:Ricin B lectin domain-containing protein n=1 Tax=Clathrus columnatus TaxID=1419009 RepID=A0AAV5A146_9AGAM|nr:hypothetical protein Clacol_002187 [Clathrus columnatus]
MCPHCPVSLFYLPQFAKSALFRIEPVTLKSGIYTIHNGTSPGGRSPFEEQSLHPKAIYNATDEASSFWYIHAENNGKYKLLNLGGLVAAEKDLLLALVHPKLDHTDPKFQWTVEPQFHQGRFLYTIKNSSRDGWFTTSDKFSQINVGPLASAESLPPQYSPNALFRVAPFVLKSGFYKIRNNKDLVGRASIEDESLNPKPILNKTDNPDVTWFIQNTGTNRYKLSASQGFDVGSLDSTSEKFRVYDPLAVEEQQPNASLVFAILKPNFVGPNWIIIPRFKYGQDVYTYMFPHLFIQIRIPSPIFVDRSWFAHEEKRSQIEIKNVLLDTLPIAPNLLFKLEPLYIPMKKAL